MNSLISFQGQKTYEYNKCLKKRTIGTRISTKSDVLEKLGQVFLF